MSTDDLAGITWCHPRGYAGLEAIGRSIRVDAPTVRWDRQPLEGFESYPVDELADSYDLIVLDHPCLGSPAVRSALVPVEEIFTAEEIREWQNMAVGACWTSYRYHDQQWAVPIDAAAQACVYRPDLLTHSVRTWDDVLALPRELGIVLCLGGPHALLMLLAIVSGLGAATDDTAKPLLPASEAIEALRLMRELWSRCDRDASMHNPIEVHELLAHRDDLALCPLTFSYASYASPAISQARPLLWADAPTVEPDAAPGSILGGTGLAIARRATHNTAAAAFVRAYQNVEVQRRLPRHGAQPASLPAWNDGDDPMWSRHCTSTLASVLAATIRPRHAGWIGFQERASAAVRDHLNDATNPVDVIDALNAAYRLEVTPMNHQGDSP